MSALDIPLRLASTSPRGLAGIAVLVALAAAALLWHGDPFAMVGRPFIWPGVDPRFPLGTDSFGRDLLTGLFAGARVSLLVGIAAAALAALLGVSVGVVAGYFGGWVDHLLMRATELFQTMPPFLFVVTLVSILSPSLPAIVLAVGLTSWTQTARLVRAETLRVRDADYIQAARVVGMGDARIILTHVLHNVLSPVVVTGSILVGTAILTEAALSFLGLGDPNVMSWGSMIGDGRQVLRTAWYICALPGAAIVVTVVAVSFLGDWLNQALDPRSGFR